MMNGFVYIFKENHDGNAFWTVRDDMISITIHP